MIPLAVPNLAGNEAKYLQECISSTFVSSVGPFVKKFEEMVAEASGTRFAVSTSSGTTALHLALLTLGVGPQDLVIIPSFTFIATANAVAHCGAQPWIFDVDKDSWSLDPQLLAETLEHETDYDKGRLIHRSSGKRVAAIVPVHILGTPADMDAIGAIAKRYELPVIADGAAALGSMYKNRKAGTLADATMYSFNGNKTMTAGGGGIIASNDEAYIARARHLSSTARVGTEYHHDAVGYNYRMTNLQAAVGIAQMENMEAFVEKKIQIRARYDEAFRDYPGISLFPQPSWAKSACWFSGIFVKDQSQSISKIAEKLRNYQIEARSFWKPIHLQPPYQQAFRTTQNVATEIWTKILTLPCSTNLTEGEQEHVIKACKEALHV